MLDTELLKLAAKAVGIDVSHFCKERKAMVVFAVDENENPDSDYWNPLTDDGDAFRLAVKLGFATSICTNYTVILGIFSNGKNIREEHGDDPYAATRRAIVRAAAIPPNNKEF